MTTTERSFLDQLLREIARDEDRDPDEFIKEIDELCKDRRRR